MGRWLCDRATRVGYSLWRLAAQDLASWTCFIDAVDVFVTSSSLATPGPLESGRGRLQQERGWLGARHVPRKPYLKQQALNSKPQP